jgi:hypothetical protein
VQSTHAIAAAECLVPAHCIHPPPVIEHANKISLISIEYNIGTLRLIFHGANILRSLQRVQQR